MANRPLSICLLDGGAFLPISAFAELVEPERSAVQIRLVYVGYRTGARDAIYIVTSPEHLSPGIFGPYLRPEISYDGPSGLPTPIVITGSQMAQVLGAVTQLSILSGPDVVPTEASRKTSLGISKMSARFRYSSVFSTLVKPTWSCLRFAVRWVKARSLQS